MDTEQQQFEELVRSCQAAVCAVAFARLRDRARSEEIAQEAFLLAWLRRADTPPSIGWVCGIARNLARNAARRPQEVPSMTETGSGDPRDALVEREQAAQAAAALARLPEHYREAVVLYYRADESHAEVAAALGISEVAARQRVHRGRAKLRSAVEAVELALRSTRPGPAFTAAVVTAWLAHGRTAAAAAATRPLGTGSRTAATASGLGVRGLMVASAAGGALVIGTIASVATGALGTARPSNLTIGATAVAGAATGSAAPALDVAGHRFVRAARPVPRLAGTSARTVDLDFTRAPARDLIEAMSYELDVPIWVDPAIEPAFVDEHGHALDPLVVIDDAITVAHARRDEIEAVRLVSFGGLADAAVLGGDLVSIHVVQAPLGEVLGLIEVPLHRPIGRIAMTAGLFPQEQPSVTLDVTGVSAGAALQQVLAQLGLGYELTTGYAITPRGR